MLLELIFDQVNLVLEFLEGLRQRVGEHGVILTCGGRSAVFLPQVPAEQGWGREMLLTHLARKAGLSDDAWRGAGAEIDVFTAEVFEENDDRL